MDPLTEFLQQEAERLQACWTAFLAPFKNLKLPLPPRYAEEFARAEKLPPEKKKHVLADLLEETREVLSWLLSQRELRETLAVKGRLNDLEEILSRLRELEEQVDYLKEELLRDDLTKLWNRRALNIFYPKILEDTLKGEEVYILVFLDLCDLKQINDTYGHALGDKILIEAAKKLKASTKRTDVPLRLGGDEFLLILAAHSLEKISPFLKDLVADPILLPYGKETLRIYFACGATDILGADTLESALHRADLAMYKHKNLMKEWLEKGALGPPPPPVLLRAYSREG